MMRIILFLCSLSVAQTDTVMGEYLTVDSLGCAGCTYPARNFEVLVSGHFEVGPWDGAPQDLLGSYLLINKSGSLPVIVNPSVVLHTTPGLCSFIFKPVKAGRFFVRFHPDATDVAPRPDVGKWKNDRRFLRLDVQGRRKVISWLSLRLD